MSAGPSLYRRHRPRSFAEVVGQQHVVRTLTNAVERDRVHHAYLFVGSRGTGKTSMAKILAACLNCADGPTVTPCGRCESCTSIASASSLDVIEMDAASSNSVDDIRALRDSVAYAPVSGRQKVYILDEAHMLSTAAWNAFLKTLEEPPPNTVFVLATTDAQKVLPTVVDRCHRFDFQRPTVEQIATVLERVAAAESISIGPESVAVLARHAAGSFRDALGTLEQLQTYAGAEISLGDVLAVLGISDVELLVRAMDAVAAGDPRGALGVVGDAVEGGHDPAAFIRELESHARELLIVALQDGAVPPELRLTPERDERLAEQAAALTTAALVRTLDLLATALTHLKAGADARTQLELALIRAARPDLDPSVQALATRVDALEGGAAVPRTRPQVEAVVEVVVDEPAPAVVAVEESPPEVVVEESPPPTPPPIVNGGGQTEAEGSLTIEVLRRQWPAVLDTVKASNPMLGAVVDEARPVELDGDRLVLAFSEDAAFQCRKAEERANRVALSEAMRAVTGCTLTLTYELRAGDAPAAPASLTEDELVARLLDEFGAELMADADEEEGS